VVQGSRRRGLVSGALLSPVPRALVSHARAPYAAAVCNAIANSSIDSGADTGTHAYTGTHSNGVFCVR